MIGCRAAPPRVDCHSAPRLPRKGLGRRWAERARFRPSRLPRSRRDREAAFEAIPTGTRPSPWAKWFQTIENQGSFNFASCPNYRHATLLMQKGQERILMRRGIARCDAAALLGRFLPRLGPLCVSGPFLFGARPTPSSGACLSDIMSRTQPERPPGVRPCPHAKLPLSPFRANPPDRKKRKKNENRPGGRFRTKKIA